MRTWTKRTAIALISVVSAVLVGGALCQAISSTIYDRLYPPPGQLVDIGGYKLHINCTGDGSPTVVLDAGGGWNSLEWVFVQPEIAKFTRVCSYDRAGNGWSNPSPNPRTAKDMAVELHELLHRSQIPGPYILVAHSMAGFTTRMYTSLYPDEVFGVVLVDAVHERQREKLPGLREPPQPSIFQTIQHKLAHLLKQLGYGSAMVRTMDFSSIPAPIRDQFISRLGSPAAFQTQREESEEWNTSAAQMDTTKNALRNKPLIVITEGDVSGLSKEEAVRWMTLQRDLVAQSTEGKLMIAERSGHMVPFQQPEIIVQAVREAVDLYRAQKE